MKRLLCALAFALVSVGGSAGAATIYASATLGPTGTFDFGYTLSANQFLGSRFDITQETNITSVGGHIGGCINCGEPGYAVNADNRFFAAIVDLGAPDALPNFLPSQLQSQALAFSFFSAPLLSADISVPLSVTLGVGNYAVIFGANIEGSSAQVTGSMPFNNTTVPGSTFFRSTGLNDPRWFSAPDDMRFTVFGNVSPLPGCGPSGGVPPKCNPSVVPLPASLPLILVGLAGLGWVGRRRNRA